MKGALLASGAAGTAAIDQYGMLAGVAMTIGSFPAFIAHSLMVVMIPSISEAYALSQYDIVLKRLRQAILLHSATAFRQSGSCFSSYADPFVFQSPEAQYYLQLL